jgi:hypothetical protein
MSEDFDVDDFGDDDGPHSIASINSSWAGSSQGSTRDRRFVHVPRGQYDEILKNGIQVVCHQAFDHGIGHFFSASHVDGSWHVWDDAVGSTILVSGQTFTCTVLARDDITVFVLTQNMNQAAHSLLVDGPYALLGGAAKALRSTPKSFPSPKKGKSRLLIRLTSMKRKTMKRKSQGKAAHRKPPKNVPYVPEDQMKDDKSKAEKRNQVWSATSASLARMTDKQTISHLQGVGILPTWTACPFCKGGLSKLRYSSEHGWRQKCTRKVCRRFIYPHTKHPVFSVASGSSSLSLNTQAQI